MGDNIFYDFENNRPYAEGLLDGISSGVCLFSISDEMKFLYFNQAADELFGYEKGGLLALTDENSLGIFHPDLEDQLYSVMIASLREERLFHYDCRILCKDGTYKWTNLSAQLQQKEGGCLYFYCVLSPTSAPANILLRGCHFLIVSGADTDCTVLTEQIERMSGTYDLCDSPLDALDFFCEACGFSDERSQPLEQSEDEKESNEKESEETKIENEEREESQETGQSNGAKEFPQAGEGQAAQGPKETEIPVDPAETEDDSHEEAPQSDVYHSIFINSSLPAMNGFELTKDIRCCSGPAGERVPIILLSAENSEERDEEQEAERMEAARELSVFAFLKKPLDQEEVSALLSSLSKLPA